MPVRALLLAVILCCGLASPASAHITVTDMPQRSTDAGPHTIILEAPDRAWGIRTIAKDYSKRVHGLVIRTRRGITCNQNVSCIRVHVGSFNHDCGALGRRWYGCASIGADPGVIWLDTKSSTVTRRNKACHELGHALGLSHHGHPGCLGEGFFTLPSRAEVRALRTVF